MFGLGPEKSENNFYAYVPAGYPAPARRRLLRPFAQHLSAVCGRTRHSRHAGDYVFDRRNVVGCATLTRLPPGRSQHRFVLHGAIAFTIAILVEGLFEFNLGDSEVLMMFVSVLALAYAAIRNAQTADGAFGPGLRGLEPGR